jgi:hypothetical protein
MDKHILAAVLRLNKSIPLLRVEPLHGAERHCLISTVDVLRYRCGLGLTMGLVEPREGIGCAQGRGRSNLRVRMATPSAQLRTDGSVTPPVAPGDDAIGSTCKVIVLIPF